MTRDLTRGSILKNLLMISIPTMIGFSAQMIYDIVDIFWLGRISGQAIAGVTIFSTIFWIVESLNEVIGVSSISLISQSFGKKDIPGTNRAIEQTITFKFIVAALAALFLALFLKPIMGFFSDTTVTSMGLEYGYIRLFFLPVMFSSYSVNTALRCIGDAKTPMFIMLGTSLLNVILDPFLIFDTVPFIGCPGAGLGIFGAALATVISQTLAFLTGFFLLFSGKRGIKPSLKKLFRLDKSLDKKLITIGLPNGIEIFLRNISMAAILKYVSIFGTAAIAAYGIGGRLIGIAFMPLVGLSMGGSAIVGQCLGAEDVSRAKKTCHVSATLSASVMAFFTLVSVIWGKFFIGLFSDHPEVISIGADFLRYATFALIFIGIGFGLSIAFSGSGYNLPFLVSSIIGRWAFQIPFLIIAVTLLKAPLLFVWFSFIIGDVAELSALLLFYRQGKWQTKRV
ncbi:MAG TPA: MATE family efflux transporter [Candidatus Mcinerneyibacteriales bacterium]|nr:MATE family efflux transporter [Candidatus Mcinerneyibacteriales bacterium]HPQ89743.1 MATE family efflux transporter [Candidatus Mcinerneyibacteriales bacterium]